MATILLVDDMTAARIALRRILERAGHDLPDDPAEGSAMHRQGDMPVDISVADCLKPKSGGAELIADLRREFPDIKILAVAATDGDFSGPWQQGGGGILATPLAIAQLPRTVEKVLRRWH